MGAEKEKREGRDKRFKKKKGYQMKGKETRY